MFQPLTEEILHDICRKQINELIVRLDLQGLSVDVHDSLIPHLVTLADPAYGARNIRNQIQTHIEHKIAERLTKKDQPKTLKVRLRNKRIVVTKPRTRR